MEQYVQKHASFVKAILISEFITDSEVFRFMAEDIQLADTEEHQTVE